MIFWFFGTVILCYNLYETYEPTGLSFGSLSFNSLRKSLSSSVSLGKKGKSKKNKHQQVPPPQPSPSPDPHKRLAIIALCREKDAEEMALSMVSFDNAYNKHHLYDYLIFSETEWSLPGQTILRSITNSTVLFPVLTNEEWNTPNWIDRKKFQDILKGKSFYGNSESYRRMCRFFAGPVFLTKALEPYTWAWRMDSHVRYLCDITEDPIDRLERINGTYGYALRMTELMYTVPTLWDTVKNYATEQNLWPHLERHWNLKPDSRMPRVCHYWNNLEATRLEFFRGPVYQNYFKAIDQSGGFFYERWGDAPIRTFALMLLATPNHIIQFDDIGYQHPWWYKCPAVCPGRSECTPDPLIQPHQTTDGKMCRIGE